MGYTRVHLHQLCRKQLDNYCTVFWCASTAFTKRKLAPGVLRKFLSTVQVECNRSRVIYNIFEIFISESEITVILYEVVFTV